MSRNHFYTVAELYDFEAKMAARGHYRRVSNVDRGRLIEAFEDNHADYLELADTLLAHRSSREVAYRRGTKH